MHGIVYSGTIFDVNFTRTLTLLIISWVCIIKFIWVRFTHFICAAGLRLRYDCDYDLIKFFSQYLLLLLFFFFHPLPPIPGRRRRQLYTEHCRSTCKCVLRAHKTNVYHRRRSLITRPRHNGCRSGRR